MIWNGAEAMRNAHDMTHFPFANSLKSLNFKNMNTLIRATKGENVPQRWKIATKKEGEKIMIHEQNHNKKTT